MFINNDLKFVYVSMTNSGSSSIVALLKDKFGGQSFGNTRAVIPPCCDSYHSFTVSRNPYARMISWWWSICKADGDRYGHKKELRDANLSESLSDFLLLWDKKGDYSQSKYLDVNGPLDEILKLENIEEDFNNLPFVKEHVDIPRVNVKKHPSWQGLLDENSRVLINRIYRKDFEKFNYEML